MIIITLILSNIIIAAFFIVYYLSTKKIREDVLFLRNELELTTKKIEDIDQAKREFIDIVTHELNTPLATTSGYLSMLMELPEEEVSPTVLNLAKKSYDGMQRMSKIVEDLMASSQTISEGRFQLIQVEEIIEKILEDFSEMAKERSVGLSFRPPKSIPLPLVLADPLSLKIILANLVDNALKFTKQGEVLVEAEPQRDYMLVKVIDTGVGIKPEDQKRIFEKFFQADSSRTREAGGTGVGLFIVRNLVDKQGGKIWVESKEGSGTTFYFTLPLSS